MKELHLFAGAGGGILGGLLLGHTPVCAVEIDPYCRRVLRARQADGYLPASMEIHDDVTTFDAQPWQGRVDVVAGGFPCQDISVAGKGAGIDGGRSSLWWHMHRIVCDARPRWVWVENSPALVGRGLDRVLRSLAQVGYDAEWCVLGARHVGAPHRRDRIWILAADANCGRREQRDAGERQHEQPDSLGHVANSNSLRSASRDATGQMEAATGGKSAARNRLATAVVGGRADVPNAASGQDHGRDGGVVGSSACGGQSGHAASGVGGADDTDADMRRREEQRVEEHGEQRSACGHQPDRLRPRGRRDGADLADADLSGREQQRVAVAAEPKPAGVEHRGGDTGPCDAAERGVGRGVDGLAAWLDRSAAGFWDGNWETTPRVTAPPKNRTNRLHALGNGQVPQVSAAAWTLLMRRFS